MKKALHSLVGAVILGVCASTAQAALILHDPFNYTPGDLGGNGGWTDFNGPGDLIQVTSGSLAAPSGLAASTGNKVSFSGAGQESIVNFASQNSGTVYSSFLISITSIPNSSATVYLGGFSQTLNTQVASGFVYRRDTVDLNTFNLGMVARQTNSGVVFSSTQLALNSINLVVVAHTFVGGGTTNDITSFWLNPTSFGGSAPTPDFTATNVVTDVTNLNGFLLNQNSAPGVLFDELRIGTTWGDVTPAAVPEPASSALLLGGLAGVLLWQRRKSALV